MTWLDWQNADGDLIDFVAGLIGLRRRFPQLRRRRWLTGKATDDQQPDVVWWHPAGRPMGVADWQSKKLGVFGLQLAADPENSSLLCLINRDDIPVPFLLPAGDWWQVCDSSAEAAFAACRREHTAPVAAHSVQLLHRA
jgi:glycogen operon protein